jgi:hypothetical protein
VASGLEHAGPEPGGDAVTADPQSPWTGPWADDARRIFAILQNHDGREGHQATSADGSSSSAECRSCPLCQGMALMRRSGPEVLDRVAELAAGLAATLRATTPEPTEPTEPADPTEPASPSGRLPVTVPIDVSE